MSISMDTLKQNMISEIKKFFDEYLDEKDEEKCNYLKFDDFDKFQDFHQEFLQEHFNGGYQLIDYCEFREEYDFDWFDAFKIIKECYDDYDCPFESYDDKEKSWEAFCYSCAREVDFLESDEYKIWYSNPKESFINKCNKQLEHYSRQLISLFTNGPEKLEFDTLCKFYENLKKFDIENATLNLQVINLLFQKSMKKYEDGEEGTYISICIHFRDQYKIHFKFKEQAIELKDM